MPYNHRNWTDAGSSPAGGTLFLGGTLIIKDCAREECNKTFEVRGSSDKKKYCGNSCAAKVNNKAHPKRKTSLRCKVYDCDEMIRAGRSFCENHKLTGRRENQINDWLAGRWSGGSKTEVSDTVRNYLLEQAEYKCSKCGFDTPHPDDGRTILEIDHINGDGSDHSPENLAVLCPNCHALTSTYRARNKGKGRKVYYLRVDTERNGVLR